MKTLGVDVSHWEGQIDWPTAARWIPFAYYKCTEGESGIDNTFSPNKRGCQTAGLPHAPYHYYHPELDPLIQANHFIATAGRDYLRYIVDVEEQVETDPVKLKAFLDRCEQLTAIKPAIYTSADRWNTWVHPKPMWANSYDLVVAHYTSWHVPTLPIGWGGYRMWQFSDCHYFPGLTTEVDADWFNGSLDQVRQWFGNYKEIEQPANPLRVRSYFDHLHIRQLPSVTSREIDHLDKGDLVEVEEVGGKDVWVRHAAGWTAVEIDGYRYMEVVR